MVGSGVSQSVFVADLSVVVVSRVGIAALTIAELVADRIVVVALNANRAAIAQEF